MYFSSCKAVGEIYKHNIYVSLTGVLRNFFSFRFFISLWFDTSNLESKRMSREYHHTPKINGSHYISLTAQ